MLCWGRAMQQVLPCGGCNDNHKQNFRVYCKSAWLPRVLSKVERFVFAGTQVETLAGKVMAVEVDANASLAAMRAGICQAVGIAAKQQRLIILGAFTLCTLGAIPLEWTGG